MLANLRRLVSHVPLLEQALAQLAQAAQQRKGGMIDQLSSG